MKLERYYDKVRESIVTKARATKVSKDNLERFLAETMRKDISAINTHFNTIRRKYADNFLMRAELSTLSTKCDAAVKEYVEYMTAVQTALADVDAEYVYALDDTDKEIADVAVTGFFTLNFDEEVADCLVGVAYVFDEEQGKVVTVPTGDVKRLWGVFTNVVDSSEVYEYSANVTMEDAHNLIPTGRATAKEIFKQWQYWESEYTQIISDNTAALKRGDALTPNIIYYDAAKDTTNLENGHSSYTFNINTVKERLTHFNSEGKFGRLLICSDCGRVFRLTGSEISFYTEKELVLPKRCLSCRSGVQRLVCCDCGKEFTLKHKEIQFYESKGFDLPKRCYDCRKVRKEAKANGKYTRKEKHEDTKA